MEKALTREEFKKAVFDLTNGKCCVPGCNCDAIDAHHIMNRHLWSNGGYIITNGAALCEKHHLDAEKGIITPWQCIEFMKIPKDRLQIPDELEDGEFMTKNEYIELLMNDELTCFGELK